MSNHIELLKEWLERKLRDPETLSWTTDLLWSLCTVDSSISSDIDKMRVSESRCFALCEQSLEAMGGARIRRLPIDGKAFEADADYTIPYYAGKLSSAPGEVYRGRCNLLASAGSNGTRWILNAHVDTVAPYIPPSMSEDSIMCGRGTVDDKGGVVIALLTWRMLQEAVRNQLLEEIPPLDLLFVIDEEAGGNGTLGALPHLRAGEDSSVIVLEPTNLIPYPANRGAVWFKLELDGTTDEAGAALFDASAAMIYSIGEAGKRIKTSSQHPLFCEDDVQTCFGVINQYGLHPSSACDKLDLVVDSLPDGIGESDFVSLLGECFSEEVNSGRIVHHTQPPVAEKASADEDAWIIHFDAQGGHMGSKVRDDDAILKASHVFNRLRSEFGVSGRIPGQAGGICIEGGQGFLPNYTIDEIKELIREAALDGLKEFCEESGQSMDEYSFRLTFDKLHNRAYCSKNIEVTHMLSDAVQAFSHREASPVAGWQASCDARIFSRKFKEVVTFGAGRLEHAHQDDEYVCVEDLVQAAAALTYAIASSGEGK